MSGPNMNELQGYAEERVYGEIPKAQEPPENPSTVKWWLLAAAGIVCCVVGFVFFCLSILLGVLL